MQWIYFHAWQKQQSLLPVAKSAPGSSLPFWKESLHLDAGGAHHFSYLACIHLAPMCPIPMRSHASSTPSVPSRDSAGFVSLPVVLDEVLPCADATQLLAACP